MGFKRWADLAHVARVGLPQHSVPKAGHDLAALQRGPHKVLHLLLAGVVAQLHPRRTTERLADWEAPGTQGRLRSPRMQGKHGLQRACSVHRMDTYL